MVHLYPRILWAPRPLLACIGILFSLLLNTPLCAQVQIRDNHFIVLFQQRSFDLQDYTDAIRQEKTAAQVAQIVQQMEQAVQQDQADFVTAIQTMGGQVLHQYWIINGASIQLPPGKLAAAQALAGVSQVLDDHLHPAHLGTATNAAHHNSDAANLKLDLQGRFLLGQDIGVAVLDTGIDVDMDFSGRPHAAFYPGGNPLNNTAGGLQGSHIQAAVSVTAWPADDFDGHGSFVAGCVAANKWNSLSSVDNGVTRDVDLVSVRIADGNGFATDAGIIAAWQWVASNKVLYKIGVANNSFSGSPFLSDPVQQVLDRVARISDILICVSAGNLGSDTGVSQSAFNGLAVGSVNKNSLNKSSFSAVGPLFGSSRTYPDITAVGASIVSVAIDNEANAVSASGTSFASPIVAGTAALLRQANPNMDASMVMAVLLNTTNVTNTNRNRYGLGILRADDAADQALAETVVQGEVRTDNLVAEFPLQIDATGVHSVTAVWMRNPDLAMAIPNLDLQVFNPSGGLVGSDGNLLNAYEKVRFNATSTGLYNIKVTWANAPGTPPVGGDRVAFALAGSKSQAAPLLNALPSTNIPAFSAEELMLTGQHLASVTSLTLGGVEAEFHILDDNEIRFLPPLQPFGSTNLVVSSSQGSDSLALQVIGNLPPVLTGPSEVTRSLIGGQAEFNIYADTNWTSMILVSTLNQPSVLPGVYDLGIGNNFAELVQVITLQHGLDGVANITFPTPLTLPAITIYCQAISIDLASPSLPFPATNVLEVQIK